MLGLEALTRSFVLMPTTEQKKLVTTGTTFADDERLCTLADQIKTLGDDLILDGMYKTAQDRYVLAMRIVFRFDEKISLPGSDIACPTRLSMWCWNA